MGLYSNMVTKVFAGEREPFRNIQIYAGVPTGVTAKVGSFIYDSTNDDYYITTVLDTTYVKINA